jgi:hypothetical protein
VQVIQFIIRLVVLIMLMRHVVGLMICYFCYIYINKCYWLGSRECGQDSGRLEDADGIDGSPWTPDRVRELYYYGLNVFDNTNVTYD